MPEVSVIIPVYNVEKYLEQCLDSVINQTLKDIEIICINDCSTDNSLEIMQKYADIDNRIKIIDLAENMGAAPARNKGLENAKGKYIYFMDSDDYIDERYIEELVRNIEKSGTDIAFNGNILYQKNNILCSFMNEHVKHIPQSGKIISNKEEIMTLPCMTWCRLYKKSFLDKHNIKWLDIHCGNDFVFHYTSEIFTDKIWAYIGSPYYYNYREEGLSQQNLLLREALALNKIYDFYEKHDLLNKINFKLFAIYPPFTIQNKEQYMTYKKCFAKIQDLYKSTINKYSDFDIYVFNAIMNTENFEEFKNNYPSKLFSSFLRQNIKRSVTNA